jgi:hypothetical protein
MVKFILIKKNDFLPTRKTLKTQKNKNYDDNVSTDDLFKAKSNYVDMEKFKESTKDIIEILDLPIEDDEWIVKIIEKIQLDTTHYGDLVDCYEGKDCIYQLFGCFPNQDDKVDQMPKNMLGSFISCDKKLLFNTVVLFKTELPSTDKTAKVIDVTIEDLVSLVMDNFYHTGVRVYDDNRIEQVYFNNGNQFVDPLNNFGIKHTDHILLDENYGVVENRLLKFNLNFIYNSKDDTQRINEPMTRLMQRIVKGNGIITSPYKENSYYDLYKQDIINLLKIDKHLDIEEEDISEEKNSNGVRVIKNKYRILNNKLKKLKV